MEGMRLVLAMVEKGETPVFCLIDRDRMYCPEAVVYAINTARLTGVVYVYATLSAVRDLDHLRHRLNHEYIDRFIGDVSGMEINEGEFTIDVIPANEANEANEECDVVFVSHKIVVKYTKKAE